MTVTFRDNIGILKVNVDSYGIQFLGGYAYFSDDATSYMVPVADIIEIMGF